MPASLYCLTDLASVTAMCRKIPPSMGLQAAPPQGTVSLSLCVTDTTGPIPVLQGQQQIGMMGEEETTDFPALDMHRLLINH